jgi:methyl coenzyme M reductase beta subunit
LGEDNDAVRNLVQEIRRSADVSAISGKKFAHRIQVQSIKAAKAIRQTLDAEVTKVADAIHEAFRKDIAAKASKSASAVKVSTKQVAKATPIGRKLVRA